MVAQRERQRAEPHRRPFGQRRGRVDRSAGLWRRRHSIEPGCQRQCGRLVPGDPHRIDLDPPARARCRAGDLDPAGDLPVAQCLDPIALAARQGQPEALRGQPPGEQAALQPVLAEEAAKREERLALGLGPQPFEGQALG